jgi:hypothetical protein
MRFGDVDVVRVVVRFGLPVVLLLMAWGASAVSAWTAPHRPAHAAHAVSQEGREIMELRAIDDCLAMRRGVEMTQQALEADPTAMPRDESVHDTAACARYRESTRPSAHSFPELADAIDPLLEAHQSFARAIVEADAGHRLRKTAAAADHFRLADTRLMAAVRRAEAMRTQHIIGDLSDDPARQPQRAVFIAVAAAERAVAALPLEGRRLTPERVREVSAASRQLSREVEALATILAGWPEGATEVRVLHVLQRFAGDVQQADIGLRSSVDGAIPAALAPDFDAIATTMNGMRY